jgi:hypothetical protein
MILRSVCMTFVFQRAVGVIALYVDVTPCTLVHTRQGVGREPSLQLRGVKGCSGACLDFAIWVGKSLGFGPKARVTF